MTLLTYQQAADRLAISVSHVRALARAAELAGTVPIDHIPPRLRRYLNSGFPRPRLIGGSRRLARIEADKLENWIDVPVTTTRPCYETRNSRTLVQKTTQIQSG